MFSSVIYKILVALVSVGVLLPVSAIEDQLILNDLRFTNRARCALDSEKPSESAFILLNNMDIARAIYRVAKNQNVNSTDLTKTGIQKYRQTTISLLNLIHKKLVNRELPLLMSDATSTKSHIPGGYKSLMEKCSSDDYCPELDQYLEKIWSISSSPMSLAKRQEEFYNFDNFHSKDNFLQNEVFEDDRRVFEYRCHYLKKFSPLEAHLFGTKPDKGVLESIAKTAINKNEYIARCDDFGTQENLKVATYEINVPNLKVSKWNDQGFDYWNSVRVYFSYAFRNANETLELAKPFGHLFKALAIEDSLIIVPNGCKSLTPPKCESDYLNQNAIREFAKSSYKKNALNLDILDSVPEGAQDDLLKDPFTAVNNDILGLGDYQTSDAWLDNFRENFSGSRTIVKRKVLRSVNYLDTAVKNIDPLKLTEKLKDKFYYAMNASLEPQEKQNVKNDLFYLCSEFTFATNEELSFIRSKINLLKDLKLLDQMSSKVVDTKAATFFNFFETVSKEVNLLCGKINQNKVWDKDFSLNKAGFSSWYLDKVYENKIASIENDLLKQYLQTNKPLINYSNYNKSKSLDDVVCVHEIDCARKTLKSIVDLYSALQYADTFWSLDQKLKSPNIFNPYAERTACRVYDPWYKTKQTMFNFFTDMAQGALATVAPGVLFAKFDLKPGKVVSFNQLVKDGKIVYDARYNKAKVQASLTADFGNLLGIPCAVTVSNGEPNPYDYIQFTGISARACNENEKNQVNVSSASDISPNDQKKSSQCIVCALNFETISQSAVTLSQTAAPQFFIVRALVRLYRGLKDTLNIPHSWETNPQFALATYKRFGTIPDKCVRDLIKGRACMANACEAAIVEKLHTRINGEFISSNTANSWKGRASAKVSSCNQDIQFKVVESRSQDQLQEETCSVREVIVPENCKGILK